jgi:hypothetical protein
MLSNDLRYALRLMRRNAGFTVVAMPSLALGAGANIAIFSLFYTVMLRQLPVAHPEQLVEFLYKDPGRPRDDGYRRWDEFENIRDRNHVFSAVTGMTFENLARVRTIRTRDPHPRERPGKLFRGARTQARHRAFDYS